LEKMNCNQRYEEILSQVVPGAKWIMIKDKSTLLIYAGSDWEGFRWEAVRIQDIADYYRHQANYLSGARSLGMIIGD